MKFEQLQEAQHHTTSAEFWVLIFSSPEMGLVDYVEGPFRTERDAWASYNINHYNELDEDEQEEHDELLADDFITVMKVRSP